VVFVSPRPVVFVSGLTFADYLLWTWSLNHNHDVLALISGLTLPPLVVACLWLIVLSVARVLAHFARMPRVRVAHERSGEARSAAQRARVANGAGTRQAATAATAASAAADAHAGKLAA
jgi:hypothetical protein